MRTRKPPRRLFRRRPPAVPGLALGQAMATWGREGKSMLVVCARIGDASHVPPGYLTADCSECGKGCWLNPDVHAMASRLRMPIVATCTRCLATDGPGE